MKTYLEVTGTGLATQAPDRLTISIAVTTVQETVSSAMDQMNRDIQAVTGALRRLGLDDSQFQTTSSSVFEEYSGPENTRTGFRASQDLAIQVHDLVRLGETFDTMIAAAGDDFRLNHLSWGIADESDLVTRAREAAYADARTKAGALAALAGTGVGKLLQITELNGAVSPIPRLALTKTDVSGFAPERGTCNVEVSLTARWALT